MTNIEALKKVYKALGGNEDNWDATTNDRAIDLVASVCPDEDQVLPAVTAEDNGKILTVVDGAWAAVEAI